MLCQKHTILSGWLFLCPSHVLLRGTVQSDHGGSLRPRPLALLRRSVSHRLLVVVSWCSKPLWPPAHVVWPAVCEDLRGATNEKLLRVE